MATRDSSSFTSPPSVPSLNGTPVLSSFIRDAIKEKASRELALLRAQIDAFASLRGTQAGLTRAASTLTSFLGALSTISADGTTITRAKKLRKLLDEAKDAADSIAEGLAVDAREQEALVRRDAIAEELAAAGIEIEGGARVSDETGESEAVASAETPLATEAVASA